MRKIVNNNQGYILIVVLLIIVIIAILTPPIISKIMSSSSQFQIVEEDIQLEKLGEMGMVYTEKVIESAEKTATEIAIVEAEKAGDEAVKVFLEPYYLDNTLPFPSQTEIDNVFRVAYEEKYLEVFKTEFKLVMELYFPSMSQVESEDSNEFIGDHSNEIKVKNDELYKYEAGYTITDSDDTPTEIIIKYRVFMTVDGEYQLKDALPMQVKTITINFK